MTPSTVWRLVPALGITQIISWGTLYYSIAVLGANQFFGEMSLLDGGPRSATVVAETSLRLLVIRRRDFSTLLQTVPGMTQNLLVTLCRRVRQAERGLDVSRQTSPS